MLINATRSTEVRAAILHDGKVEQLEIEVEDAALLKGNIYKGVIANVEASLNACFIDIGTDKHGFLPFDEIAPSAWHERWSDPSRKPRVEDVMRRKREIIVQVVKDAQGQKGPALTTYCSIAGRYIVLMPQDESRGVSRKVENEAQRKSIKELASGLKVPDDVGFIVRTAGLDRTKTELNRDVAQLVRTWKDVEKKAKRTRGAELLFEDRDLVVRMLRDYYTADISQIVVDTPDAYRRAADYFKKVMPRSKQVLTQYVDKVPLFTRYQVEQQVDEIFARRVELRSGGYILIDPTEALIAIDVNSGRSNKQKSQEETALHTNLEAASEIARQLRLRDLGGLVIIDFIDMATPKMNRQVEKAFKDALKADKARTYLGRISDNGLLELNRQRIRQSLEQQTHRPCPTCTGRGVIPSPDFVALTLIRRIEAKAAGGSFDKFVVSLHPELADHMQNVHRRDIVAIEDRFAVAVAIEGRPGMHRNEQDLRGFTLSDLGEGERRMLLARREALREAERRARLTPEQLAAEEAVEEEIEEDFPEEEPTIAVAEDELVVEGAPAEDGDNDEGGDEAGTDGGSDGEGEGNGGRRRRRRRRRRGRRDGAAPQPASADGAAAAGGPDQPEPVMAVADNAPGTDDAEGDEDGEEEGDGGAESEGDAARAEGEGGRRRGGPAAAAWTRPRRRGERRWRGHRAGCPYRGASGHASRGELDCPDRRDALRRSARSSQLRT
jgi:ribonuclease E